VRKFSAAGLAGADHRVASMGPHVFACGNS